MSHDDRLLFARFAAHGRKEDLEALVKRHRPLAQRLARRHARGGLPLEDVEQVACVGLILAIKRFDAARGTAFATFAVPTILGEIRRYRRQAIWPAHVPRTVQQRAGALRGAADDFAIRHGRAPRVQELAAALACSEEEVLDAIHANQTRSAPSIDATYPGGDDDHGAIDRLGQHEPGYARVEDVAYVSAALATLTSNERDVLLLRFEDELSQRQIARRVGLPERKVARLIPSALDRLRAAARIPATGGTGASGRHACVRPEARTGRVSSRRFASVK